MPDTVKPIEFGPNPFPDGDPYSDAFLRLVSLNLACIRLFTELEKFRSGELKGEDGLKRIEERILALAQELKRSSNFAVAAAPYFARLIQAGNAFEAQLAEIAG